MNSQTALHFDLQAAARETMHEHGFQPDFSPQALEQVQAIQNGAGPQATGGNVRDLRSLLWSSIDNDTSRDLDQIEYAERLPNGDIRVQIAIADVDALVAKGSPLDQHASRETTSVYAGVVIFPMLPEVLSTNLTSLLEAEDRLAFVTEFTVNAGGHVGGSALYPAIVHNRAQLAYNAVGAWLEGSAEAPAKVAASSELQAQLKLQSEAAQRLREERYRHGALNIETIETHPVFLKDKIVGIERQQKNLATELIEDFMIAANEVVARSIAAAQWGSIRRIVKTPKRWERIVELAAQLGEHLPAIADSQALNQFLIKRRAADPDHFPDLSLAVIKLLGPGEYVVELPGQQSDGHFGLAVQDYTHSTAPNRRFADLTTQHLLKALVAGSTSPYSSDELTQIAANCTLREDQSRRVEREMQKRIAAVAMHGRIGEFFDAIVTGVNENGTFVRALNPHMEGMLVEGHAGVDVGDRIKVKLVNTDPRRGFIDFVRVSAS
ncbi:MAG TPA: RNB domain-containing ribonuclease [Acidisarcina sp.]|nr:RNB domain-containing ribonuclease [Acidisarcina sp.]